MSIGEEIKLAAERAVGRPVTRLHAVPVIETYNGETIWEGFVEVFWSSLPPPDYVYGFAVEAPAGVQYVAVILGMPPINSPLDAVRSYLVSKLRK